MNVRVDYAGGVSWLPMLTARHVAGAWWIGQRKDENPGRHNLGLSEYGYGLSNWAVYHGPSGLVACWMRGRKQAEALALRLADVWNGDELSAAPLETRNAVRLAVSDAQGRVKP